jgi:hypothetical protein
MDEEPRSKSWWSTLPGVLTAIAGIITAVTGLIVTLHQAGVFQRGEKQPPQAQYDTIKPKEATKTPSVTGAAPGATTPSPSGPAAKYPINLSVGDEVRAGPVVYKFLAAQLDHHSEDKLSLRFSIRFTNTEVRWGVAIGPDFFRLLVDGVLLAPKESFIDVVEFQSAKQGDVLFIIPTTASNVVLQIGEVGGKETSKIPIGLKATRG